MQMGTERWFSLRLPMISSPAPLFPQYPQSRSEPVVCWCLYCWLCCLRMFACAEKCLIPWIVMLQKWKINKRGRMEIFSLLFLWFSAICTIWKVSGNQQRLCWSRQMNLTLLSHLIVYYHQYDQRHNISILL